MEEPWVRRRRRPSCTKSEDAGAQSRKWIPLLFICIGLFSITQAVKLYLSVGMEAKNQQTLEERDFLEEERDALKQERDALREERDVLNYTLQGMLKKCPCGWQPYMYSCYYPSEMKRNWNNSRNFCKSKGADLAIITSLDEMNFINGLYCNDKEAWIGLKTNGVEENWTWVDGTALNPNATFWGRGQPNRLNGRNQDCVELWHSTTGLGKWNDEMCIIEQFFICEL